MIDDWRLLPVGSVDLKGGSKARAAMISAVFIAHVVVIAALAFRLEWTPSAKGLSASKEIQATIIAPTIIRDLPPVLSEPVFASATLLPAEEPEIKIEETQAVSLVPVSAPSAVTIPPRPDPAFVNQNPMLPAQYAALGKAQHVTLTVFVKEDGHVGTSRVEVSSGTLELDRMAQLFIAEKWRFRPAECGQLPVSAWTSVLVTFV